jgi:hypothetical protein
VSGHDPRHAGRAALNGAGVEKQVPVTCLAFFVHSGIEIAHAVADVLK